MKRENNRISLLTVAAGISAILLLNSSPAPAAVPEILRSGAGALGAPGNPDGSIRLAQDDRQAKRLQAAAYVEQRRYDEALAIYRDLAARYPKDPESYLDIASVYDRQGRRNEARESRKKGADAYFQRAEANFRDKAYDQARANYRKTLEIDPGNFQADLNYGDTYYVEKDYDNAMKFWQGTIQRFPKEWQGFAWLGDAYLMKKEYDSAILHYKKALDLNPNQETYRVLGGTYLSKKDYFQALVSLQKSLELKPTEAATHKKLGELYEETERFPEAVKAYERFLELDPKNSDAAKIRQKVEDLRRR